MNKNENVILDHSGCEEIFTELPIFNCKNFYGIKLKAEKIVSVDAYIKNNVNIENADFTILSLARVRIGDTLYLTKSKLVEFYISDSIVKRIDARELYTKRYDNNLESKIENTKIENLDFTNSKLNTLLISHANLKDVLFPYSEVKKLKIHDSTISNYLNMNFSSFKSLIMSHSNIKYINMNDSNIQHLSIAECSISDFNIINSEIENSLNLTETTIKNLNLEETKASEDLIIQGSKIFKSNLNKTIINRMSLKNTKIKDIYFPETINELDLRGTNIKYILSDFPTIIDRVLVNDSTKIPSHFEEYVRQFL